MIDGTVLVVDDVPQNIKLMDAVLSPRGATVLTADSGEAALALLTERIPDLVLLDVFMPPGIDGFETCRRIRADPATSFLPVVMVTAAGEQEKVRAIEAGADDFISKPFDQAELLARVQSLLRVKRYHDQVVAQATELREWNEQLESRVAAQVSELERLGRLQRFLSPQIAKLIMESNSSGFPESHRREITVVFTDLRGFTSFAETTEPEETMAVLADYHGVLGLLVHAYEGTVERFAGDGMMVFFNDPVPCPDAPDRAVRMAVEMRASVARLSARWRSRGHHLGFGVGIAQGYATLGRVGFEGRYDYAAIGTVTNTAARLCAEAEDAQVLVTARVMSSLSPGIRTRPFGPIALRGFAREMEVFEVLAVDADEVLT